MADLTTIQIDTEARDKLKEVAKANRRSAKAQVTWWIEQAHSKLYSEQESTGKNSPIKGEKTQIAI
jgi:predicted transcriptional regulator